MYVSDEGYQAFDTMQTYWQYKDDVSENVDALEGLYRTNHEYLEVRDVVGGDWIKTPILSADFDNKSQGWYQND